MEIVILQFTIHFSYCKSGFEVYNNSSSICFDARKRAVLEIKWAFSQIGVNCMQVLAYILMNGPSRHYSPWGPKTGRASGFSLATMSQVPLRFICQPTQTPLTTFEWNFVCYLDFWDIFIWVSQQIRGGCMSRDIWCRHNRAQWGRGEGIQCMPLWSRNVGQACTHLQTYSSSSTQATTTTTTTHPWVALIM